MVKNRRLKIIITGVILFSIVLAGFADAQSRVYHLEHEWVQIWINPEGTVDLIYDVILSLDSGSNINYILIGQPNGDFTIGQAYDQIGNSLTTSDQSSDGDYKVKVSFNQPLTAGTSIRFKVTTNVGGMIFNDTQNLNHYGMQFIPTWWDEAPVNDLRIQIILPSEVTVDEVFTTQEAFWNSTSIIEDRLAIYWEKQNLSPGEKYPIGVSFPADSMPNYTPTPTIPDGLFQNVGIAVAGAFFAIIAIFTAVFVITRKKNYTSPKVSIETLGIRRGLTAVEASYLLDLKPTQIVTEILYSLLQKRAIWVESSNPTLKLKILSGFEDKKGPDENPLRYYEIDFLNAMNKTGTLNEEKLAQTIMFLRDSLEQKLRGYSRKETIEYYRKIVDKAWTQVEQAGTADLASKAYDEQMLWLLLDPNYKSRTESAFKTRSFEPNPLWFWYWYGYTHYNPNPTYRPDVNVPSQSGKPPVIPGAEFANNIATSIEKTTNNIVANLEKFANSIIPAPVTKTSHQPSKHGSSCVCACATCACACACVSCACACAGGGVG